MSSSTKTKECKAKVIYTPPFTSWNDTYRFMILDKGASGILVQKQILDPVVDQYFSDGELIRIHPSIIDAISKTSTGDQ